MLTGIEGRMAHKNEAELVLGADEILSHVGQILSKGTSGLRPCAPVLWRLQKAAAFHRQNLKPWLHTRTKQGLQTSITTQHRSGIFLKTRWARGRLSDLEPVGDEACMDMIIYTRWAAHNFPMIMNVSLPKETPKLLCRVSDVSEFPVFLAYMEQIIPALEKHLCHVQGIGIDALNARTKHGRKNSYLKMHVALML